MFGSYVSSHALLGSFFNAPCAHVQCLQRPDGVAYIAAKSYYFGVGGGTAAFVKLVNGEGLMRAEVVRVLDDGLSNKREIIRLAFC